MWTPPSVKELRQKLRENGIYYETDDYDGVHFEADDIDGTLCDGISRHARLTMFKGMNAFVAWTVDEEYGTQYVSLGGKFGYIECNDRMWTPDELIGACL